MTPNWGVGAAAMLDSRAAIRSNPNWMEEWYDRNLMKLNKGKCRNMNVGQMNPSE